MAAATCDEHAHTKCTICREDFKDPKILSCFHTFCLLCLEKYVDRNGVVQNQKLCFSCPLCRATIAVAAGGVKSFQSNFYIHTTSDNRRDRCHPPSLTRELTNRHSPGDVSSPESTVIRTQLTDLLLDTFKVMKYALEVKENSTAYAETIMANSADIRAQLNQRRNQAHQLVDAAYDECVSALKEIIQNELNHIDEHKDMVERMKKKANDVGWRAQVARSTRDTDMMAAERDEVKEKCNLLLNSLPSVLQQRKHFVLEKPSPPLCHVLKSENLFGVIVAEDCGKDPGQVSEPQMGHVIDDPGQVSEPQMGHVIDDPGQVSEPQMFHVGEDTGQVSETHMCRVANDTEREKESILSSKPDQNKGEKSKSSQSSRSDSPYFKVHRDGRD